MTDPYEKRAEQWLMANVTNDQPDLVALLRTVAEEERAAIVARLLERDWTTNVGELMEANPTWSPYTALAHLIARGEHRKGQP